MQPVTQLPTYDQVPARFGPGERSAIGLALAYPDSLLILDDEQAKQLAKGLGIGCIGTLGIVRLAKDAGFIAEVRLLVEQLRHTGGMWLSDAVAERVCREAGE